MGFTDGPRSIGQRGPMENSFFCGNHSPSWTRAHCQDRECGHIRGLSSDPGIQGFEGGKTTSREPPPDGPSVVVPSPWGDPTKSEQGVEREWGTHFAAVTKSCHDLLEYQNPSVYGMASKAPSTPRRPQGAAPRLVLVSIKDKQMGRQTSGKTEGGGGGRHR
ncbi:hypothetical protein CB1_001815025 [Camelus ferus]|nr:hypothetical protein CB1_001815025 [Camelus ferus]